MRTWSFPSLMLMVVFFATPIFAEGLTQKVQNTYKNTSSFEAQFIQKTQVKLLDRTVEEKGRLVFQKPGHFFIHYQGANERKYLSDGKTLWIHRLQDKEVEVYENMNSLVSKEALVFLGGLGTMTREFRVAESQGLLILKPKNTKTGFKKLVLSVDSDTFLVKSVQLFPQSGNESRYDFSDVRTNKSHPEGEFLPPHSGVTLHTVSE